MIAVEALSTIRKYLTAEIEISVVPELVTAFETLDKLLGGEPKPAWFADPMIINGVGDGFKALRDQFGELAEDIGQLDQFDVADKLKGISVLFSALASTITAQNDAVLIEDLPDYGSQLGFPDKNGHQLHVGDLVTYTGSERFGNGKATVVGVGDNDNPDEADDRRRPRLKLANGASDNYQPSAGRVERIQQVEPVEVP
jgi:hypothetical protein